MKIIKFFAFYFFSCLIFSSCSKEQIEEGEIVPEVMSVQNKILKFDFNINNEVIKGIIDEENKIITFNTVGLNLDNLSPIIEISENATISPTLDSNHNFNNPIDYIVYAENGDTSTYTIVINNREVNTENFITYFWITVGDKILEADIDYESNRIMIDVGQIELSSITTSITISRTYKTQNSLAC